MWRQSFISACYVFFGGCLFFLGFQRLKAFRRIENTPTSSVRSMPLGLVELHGTAQIDEPLIAPLTGKPVAFFQVWIEENQSSRKRPKWVLKHEETSSEPFALEDETGRVLLLPDGASTHLRSGFRKEFWGGKLPSSLESYLDGEGIKSTFLERGKSFRFTEWLIEVGQPFYLHGLAQERPDLYQQRLARVTEVMGEIKSDPEAMRELDTNRDGRLESHEWLRARDQALAQVKAEGISDRIVVARGKKGDLFLFSDWPEPELVPRLRLQAALLVFGGGALLVVATVYLLASFGVIPFPPHPF